MARQPSIAGAALSAVLALAALGACTPGGSTSTTSPTTEPAAYELRGPRPPAEGAWLGAAVQPTTYTPEGRIRAFQDFERVVGRELDVVHTYHPWHDPFPTAVEEHFVERGQQVLTGWAGSDCPGIAAGKYDDLIRKRANDLEAFGEPVMMAFRWEMDRPNLQGQVRSAADYIAAWKHTRKIFEEEGATNVGWVWAPTAKGFTAGHAQAYYPGDDQVDWIAVDAYTGLDLKPFSEVVRAFMTFVEKHPGKPVMVAEFGLSDREGKRPDWLRAAREYVKTQPRIKAVLYFNGNMEARATAQLALQPSVTGRRTFNDWLADPYYNQHDRRVTELP